MQASLFGIVIIFPVLHQCLFFFTRVGSNWACVCSDCSQYCELSDKKCVLHDYACGKHRICSMCVCKVKTPFDLKCKQCHVGLHIRSTMPTILHGLLPIALSLFFFVGRVTEDTTTWLLIKGILALVECSYVQVFFHLKYFYLFYSRSDLVCVCVCVYPFS